MPPAYWKSPAGERGGHNASLATPEGPDDIKAATRWCPTTIASSSRTEPAPRSPPGLPAARLEDPSRPGTPRPPRSSRPPWSDCGSGRGTREEDLRLPGCCGRATGTRHNFPRSRWRARPEAPDQASRLWRADSREDPEKIAVAGPGPCKPNEATRLGITTDRFIYFIYLFLSILLPYFLFSRFTHIDSVRGNIASHKHMGPKMK